MAGPKFKKRGVTVGRVAAGDPHFHATVDFDLASIIESLDPKKEAQITECTLVFTPIMKDGDVDKSYTPITTVLSAAQIKELNTKGSLSHQYLYKTSELEEDYKAQVKKGDQFTLHVKASFTVKATHTISLDTDPVKATLKPLEGKESPINPPPTS